MNGHRNVARSILSGLHRFLLKPGQDCPGYILSFLVVVAAVSVAHAESQSADVRFVEGLRERRLFDLAAMHCREALSNSQLDPLEQAELTGQLIRVYGERAMHAESNARAQSWKSAHDTAAAFTKGFKEHPRLLVVRVQDALVFCAEGELLRQEAEAARGDTSQQAAAALDALLKAARALQQLDEDIGRALPAAPTIAEGAVLTADELFALRNHVRLELARVYRNRGLCYPEGDDRIAAITQALEPLRAALSQLPTDDSLAWRARLEQAICYRMLGSGTDAQRVWTSLTSTSSPPELAPAIRAEEIRAELAARQADRALKKATEQLPAGAESDADFALARLEAVIAQWQMATESQSEKVEQWRSQAVALTRFIEQTHGVYWGRRAERLLLRNAAAGSSGDDVEILRRRADDLYLQSRLTEAVAAYDEGAAAASNAGLEEEEFRCRFLAALVVQKKGDLQDACDRFQKLALDHQAHPQASAAHLEAIKAALELARNDQGQIKLYEQLLLEQLNYWPRDDAADQSRVWLGLLYRHQQRWQEAVAAYTAVPGTSSLALEALQGALTAWRGLLQQTAGTADYANTVERAFAYFRQMAVAGEQDLLHTQATISAARLLLDFAPSRAAESLPLLGRAEASLAADDDPRLRDEIECLTIAALALDPSRHDEAAARLEKWRSQDTNLVLSLAEKLSAITAGLAPDQKKTIAQLQLQLVERVRSTNVDDQSRILLSRIEAMALAAAGDRARALAAFKPLAESLPLDGEVQLQYARLLDDGANDESWNAALIQWTNVAQHTPERSDSWYEAKLGVARARLELGQGSKAAQLLEYILATSPPPAKSVWDLRLKQLLARCKNP